MLPIGSFFRDIWNDFLRLDELFFSPDIQMRLRGLLVWWGLIIAAAILVRVGLWLF